MATEIIDVTPDQTLMPKLGKGGYSIPQAIAELVDNAIDARLEDGVLHVAIKIGPHGISVGDDGLGMDREEIQNAMVLGYSTKREMLGEFGLGLKTSCTNLGRKFRVMSSKLGVPFEYAVEYDEDEWLEADQSWKLRLSVSDAEPDDHYTIVSVESLAKYYPGIPETVVRDLQRRFAPFIAEGSLVLGVNKKQCRPEAFDLIDGTRTEFEVMDRLGHRITGWYGLLKQGSNKGYYGFHTYRRGRMITAYDKIAIGEHPTISRIIGEIHLDDVPVTHNKREFDRESDEYRAAVDALRAEFDELLRLARQRASSDSLTKAVKNEMERWKDSLARALEASELKQYTAPVSTPSDPEPDPDGQEVADVNVEQREKSEELAVATPGTSTPAPTSPKERVPKATHRKPRHCVKVKGKTVDFRHEFAPLGEKESWYRWTFEQEKGLEVYSNTDFPAYFTTKDKAFYAVVHIAESIAQLLVREAGESAEELDDVKQLILRKAAAVKDQWVEEEEDASP